MRDCSTFKARGKESNQAQARGPSFDAPKKNHFYALLSMGDQEYSPDVVTSMLQLFPINVYELLDTTAILSFVTPLVSIKIDVLPIVLVVPFLVSTPVGDYVVAKRVYKSCPMI